MIFTTGRLRLGAALLGLSLLVPIAHAKADKTGPMNAGASSSADVMRILDSLRHAHTSRPYDLQIKKELALALLNQAHNALQAAQYQQADELFLEGQQLVPDDIRFWIGRSHALLSGKDYSAAEVDANEALGIDAQQTDAWQLLGRIYYQTSRLPEAIDAWQQAISFGAENPGLKAMLAKARRELKVEEGMTQSYAASFVLSYDAERKPDLSEDLLDVLNQAYVEVGINLNSYPPGQIPVLIYTRQDFSKITASPGWAAGLYDGKIRIPLGGVNHVSAPLRAILFHEYTHVVVRVLTGNRCPTWLNEGMAEQIGRSQFNPPLEQLGRVERPYDFNKLSRSWKDLPASQARLAYEQSYSFVSYLVEDFGWHLLEDVLQGLAAGKTTDEAFSQAFEPYGLTLADLQRQWRQRLGWP